MIELLTAEEMRSLDARTIEGAGVPGPVLMETAGRGVLRALWARYHDRVAPGPVVVVCGRGNNGGDGFVVARCLANRGVQVRALLLGSRDRVRGDAAVHLGAYLGSGGALLEVDGKSLGEARSAVLGAAVLVDAVLGTGLEADVRGTAAEAIGWMNEAPAPVVSVDVPSGVSSDTGRVCGQAVRADLTVTFAWPKRGHFLLPGASLRGELVVVDIGIPPGLATDLGCGLRLLEAADLAGLLKRPAGAHKGTFGHVWVVGGSHGKTGAPGLAALGALRAGAGLATVASPGGLGIEARLPLEVMTAPLGPGCDWVPELVQGLPAGAGAWVVGPGMGVSEGAGQVLRHVLVSGAPVVADADALNLMAGFPGDMPPGPRVLTPHPGEAARLLGGSTTEVQADRVGAARRLAERYRSTVVLKGAGTLVCAPGQPVWLVAAGNPGMATAGTGDVLSGVVGAFLARGLDPPDAARLGAWVHAVAGDLAAARKGMEGCTAADVLEHLPEALASVPRPGEADSPKARDPDGRAFPPLTEAI